MREMLEETIRDKGGMMRKEIEKIIKEYRFDEDTHIGLGDIRLSIGEQEKFTDQICSLIVERLEKMYDASINGVVLYSEVDNLIKELEGEK